jgi:hypothetical protein
MPTTCSSVKVNRNMVPREAALRKLLGTLLMTEVNIYRYCFLIGV